ncbi:MAG: amino acid adenylation domain-containing protein, partial [Pseudomonadota bacterium]
TWWLHWQSHHLIEDGWSLPILLEELFTHYQAAHTNTTPVRAHGRAPLPTNTVPNLPPVTPYQHYIAWLQQQDQTAARTYWQDKLSGIVAPTPIPILNQIGETNQTQAEQTRTLTQEQTQAWQAYAKRQRITLNTLIQAGWASLLGRYSGETNIVFGATTSGRNLPLSGIEQMVGLFINTLPLRVDLNQPIPTLLQHLQTQQQTDNQYAYTNLADIQDWSEVPNGIALFDSLIIFENYPVDDTLTHNNLPFRITDSHSEESTNYALTLAVIPGTQLSIRLGHRTPQLHTDQASRMLAHLEQLIDGLVNQPECDHRTLPLLTTAEIDQLQAWNDTATDYPADQALVDLFEAQVMQTPDNIAVSFEGNTLTYRELNARANQVAHYLSPQVQPDTLVGICVERSLEMIIGLLGILKAGGAYVPLDPDYPAKRLAYMLQDSQVPLLLTQQRLQAQLPDYTGITCCLDDPNLIEDQPRHNLPRIAQPHHLAYVIYTSGSTGKPKGVAIEHRNLTNYMFWMRQAFNFSTTDRFIQKASISFDATVWECWFPLQIGACLVLAAPGREADVDYLQSLIIREQISVLQAVPVLLNTLLENRRLADTALHCLFCGGEALTHKIQQQVDQQNSRITLYNMYGPSEATIDATYWLSTPTADTIAIGQPVANTRIYLLDKSQQPVPIGVAGELCIAGAGLARGYLNRPELTAERFIQVRLFGNIERIYKTGDLARWLPNGNLEYLGRIDHQVKLRGFRIELGEIEAVLSQQEAVSEAVVTIYERDSNKSLAAYVTTTGNTPDISGLREALKAHLPDYMVPNSFTVLDALPLTPNGKIDRKALPEPELSVTTDWQLPRNATEHELVTVWSQVLKRTDISIHDNFFDLGGDSILSIQIVARARQAGLGLSPRDVFQHQSIADLALVVQPVSAVLAEQGLVQGEVSLTPIQSQFLASDTAEPHYFNQAMLLVVPEDLEVTALQAAFTAVLNQHDAFRLRYLLQEKIWCQSHQADFTPHQIIEDTLATPSDGLVAALEPRANYWQASLNLADGPLTRLVLFRTAAGTPTRLLWVIHHLIVDGVSWRILLDDLQTAYQQSRADEPIQLPPKSTSFKAWSEFLHTWQQGTTCAVETAHWQTLPQTLPALPLDHPDGRALLCDTAHHTLTLSQALTEQLLYRTASAYRTGINDLLLSALALMLHDWTEQQTHLIDLESHGRADLDPSLDLSRTLGWFTSLYSVALTLPDQPTDLAAVIRTIKEQLRQVPHEGIGYGLRQQQGESLPQGQILFNYLGQFDQTADTAGGFQLATESAGQCVSLTGSRTHSIEINGQTAQGQLSLTFSYSQQQYRADTIQQLAAAYEHHLQTLISHCQTHYGYTPSDFPLARIDQAQIEQLRTRYADQIEAIYPLSPMQQGMLFHSLYAPDTGAYITQLSLQLTGELHPAHLQQAWQALIDRHPILRTAFDTSGPQPLQIVLQHASLPFEQCGQYGQYGRTAVRPNDDFDLTRAPLMRVQLEQTDNTTWWLHWQSHHLIEDGWSLPILLEELFTHYQAAQTHTAPVRAHGRAPLPTNTVPELAPVTPYQHYIAWLQQQDQATARTYWQDKLIGIIAPTPIPILNQTGETDQTQAEQTRSLTAEQTQAWQAYAQRQRITLNTLIQAGWASLLGRYSGETDIVFGATTSGRNLPLPGIEQMIGLFINTLPLRVDLNQPTPALLQQLQTQQQTDNQYAYTSLADIQNWSDVPNGIALFDSLIVFENYPVDDTLTHNDLPFRITDSRAEEATNYALTLAVIPGTQLSFRLGHRTPQLHIDQASRMLAHLVRLIDGLVEQPECNLHTLPLLTKAEINQLQAWNDTATDYPADQTLIDLFEAQVTQTPEHIAVSFAGNTLSYSQLNARANQLAHYLRPQIQPDTLVGICVERSLEMIIGLLGILKAGGAYVPLDPDYPAERLSYMLADSQVPILLTQRRLQDQLPDYAGQIVCLDDPALFADQPEHNLPRIAQSRHIAYVIYTSGSTGKPKGVQNSHAGICNRLMWMQDYFALTEQDRVLQKTPFSFDVSVWELFWPLQVGAQLIFARPGGHQDPDYLQQLIQTEQISTIHFVPSMLQAWLTISPQASALQRIICSGEALPDTLQQHCWQQLPGVALYNLYGPTEAAVDVTQWACQTDTPYDFVPIGRPIANTRLYLLDQHEQLTPIGIPGELCIAGIQVARGYLNRPELTAEKFIEVDLFGNTERLYKTGDLARWLPDGNLEYLGRIDHQVKLRGFRIELGEIEAVLSQQASVSEAVVVVHERDGNKSLAAYLTAAAGEVPDTTTLRDALKARLPDYMVPNSFTVLDTLPLTPNGKINRKALPEPDQIQSTSAAIPPRDLIECELLAIWQQVLGTDQIGIQDDFFAVGGHSLLAMRLVSLIRQQFNLQLPVAVLFQQGTVAALAELIRQAESVSLPTWSNCVPLQTQGEDVPIYILPGAIGSVLYLQPLAAALGSQQPIYALQTPG